VTNILLVAHLFDKHYAKAILPGSVIYNLEQLGSNHLSDSYFDLSKRYQVWD
jgi:hypothetical protein